jgi:hypothetical protein
MSSAIEGLGLIHVNSPIPPQTAEKTEQKKEKPSYHRLMGCHKNIPGASVEDFLARSRADKEHELEIEKRQEEERAHRAKLHTCSLDTPTILTAEIKHSFS